MKFLAVFVTLAAAAYGFPATTTWTLNELSNALQSPGLDPVLIPYLEAALNQMMDALYSGHAMEAITIAMPHVGVYTAKELAEAITNPATNPAHIPYLEDALNKLVASLHAGDYKPTITVVLPPVAEPEFVDAWPVQVPEQEPGFIDVWPVQIPEQEPGFIDVWPVQIPEGVPATPVVPAPVAPAPVSPSAPSSPLVQIIVNVQKQQDIDVAASPSETPVIEDEEFFDAGWSWGSTLERH